MKQLLHQQNLSTKATEWGKHHESIAFDKYVEHQLRNGHAGLVAVKSGFVVCEEYPFLGASPDGGVLDPSSVDQYGLVEIKCPYKFREQLPEDAATHSDFCCTRSWSQHFKVERKSWVLFPSSGTAGDYRKEMV